MFGLLQTTRKQTAAPKGDDTPLHRTKPKCREFGERRVTYSSATAPGANQCGCTSFGELLKHMKADICVVFACAKTSQPTHDIL